MSEYNLSYYLSKRNDPLPSIRILLSYPLCNWVNEFYLSTREYDRGLEFVEYANEIISSNIERITPVEYERMNKKLISYKLVMLDYLNFWGEYINYFDYSVANNRYYIAYPKDTERYINEKYVLSDDGYYITVHFLWGMDRRYNIISRKLARQKSGKKTEHLRRHHRYMLSDEEVAKRYNAIISKLEMLIRR